MAYVRVACVAAGIFLLGACGGGSSGDNPVCSSAQITSTPGTMANADQAYSYNVTAPYFCIPLVTAVTCQASVEGVQLPPGAQITNEGYTVSWTPTASQANTNARFSIVTESICGNRSSQSWTVRVGPSAIASFSASSSIVNRGDSAMLTAVFEGTGRIQNLSPIASGVPLSTGPILVQRSFTLVVTNGLGAEWRRTLSIDVTPAVTVTTPASGEAQVPVNRAVSATFNKPMDPASVHSATFLLRDPGNNPVSGAVAYANGVATFTPASTLTPTSSYTATITTGVRDATGHAMASDYTWTFTTGIPDTTAPSVVSTLPANGASDVALEDVRLVVVFSEPIDPSSLTSNTFILKRSSNDPVNGTLRLIDSGSTAEFTLPGGTLEPTSSYSATVSTGIRDLAGNPLPADHSWAFITKALAWRFTATTDVPSARTGHTAVWTGTEMIVWGGHDGSGSVDSGGRYNPATDAWTATPTSGAPGGRLAHTVVWTGTEMIVWGGLVNTTTSFGPLDSGARYDPATHTWAPVSTNGAPSARYGHSAVWTGSEMIVWGGYNGGPGTNASSFPNSGARYDSATDTWQPLGTSGAPTGRWHHTAVWTGSEMVVWGGSGVSGVVASGARYNPATDAWVPTSTSGAPSARYVHTALWTGTEMIIWGGDEMIISGGDGGTGARYDPTTNAWAALPTSGAPFSTPAVWTGTEMLVWGAGGARHIPSANAWVAITSFGAPASRTRHTAVWSGTEMIVWGGSTQVFANGAELFTGGRYRP